MKTEVSRPESNPATKARGLDLDGAVNMRDLGGLATRDGRITRRNRLYRGDNPGYLSDRDVETFEKIGLRTVIDLRSQVERRRDPVRPLSRCVPAMLHVGLRYSSDPDNAVADIFPDGVTSLRDLYVAYLTHSASEIAAVYAILASLRTLPALVHCAAGKDRTGLIAALVLGSLGVEDDVIADDYAATATNMASLISLLAAADPQASDHLRHLDPVILSADGDTLLSVLEWVRALHGSLDAYVRHCGVPDEDISVLRHRLLES